MVLYTLISTIFIGFQFTNAAVFLCSNEKLELSPLQPFSIDTFSNLIKRLNNPEVFIFRSVSRIYPDIKQIINSRGYYSSYIPNGEYDDIDLDSTDLTGENKADATLIEETLAKTNITDNVLMMIFLPSKRFKRDVIPKETNGSVIYKAKNKNGWYALLYSSKPLLLKFNDSTEAKEIHLGNTIHDMVIYDNRLNVNVIPLEGGDKVTLRFSISWQNGYWSLPSVRVMYTPYTNGELNLTTDEDIMAPAYFSYHCNGHTTFSDSTGVELHIYDLQVQIDSRNGKFGDANDCVPFTTAPIWSGLFVTTILGIGLIVALTAIMDIKTMDKFDNHKTKNLSLPFRIRLSLK